MKVITNNDDDYGGDDDDYDGDDDDDDGDDDDLLCSYSIHNSTDFATVNIE